MDASSKKRALVVMISAVMVLSALAVLFNAPGQKVAVPDNNAPETINGYSLLSTSGNNEPLTGEAVMDALAENHIPMKYAYLPSFASTPDSTADIMPSYDRSPAPIGVSDFGYSMNSGLMTKYSYSTSGFLGSFMAEGFSPFYPMNNDPQNMSIQLNAVLNGVTIHGVSGYVFWIQNVMLYTPSENTIQFVSNIWSFSSPEMVFPDGAILSGSGATLPGVFYYYAGPTVSVPDTFTAIVTMNSVMNGLNNAVDFRYEITNTESTSTIAQSTFDFVTFNSTTPGTTIPVPGAAFKVSGSERTPSGMLNDAELVIGGPGGGSNTALYAANGQLKLQYKTGAGTYSNPTAAFGYGSNTGETVQGLASWWTGGQTSSRVDHLAAGPSILLPLWGSDVSTNGGTNIQGTLQPANAFMFLNSGGNYDPNTAAWGPINVNGTYKWTLPGGVDYSGAVMLSEFQTYTFTPAAFEEEETSDSEGGGPPADVGGGGDENETAAYFNVSLTFDKSVGIYTPLYAYGNDQVGNLTLGNSNINGTVNAKNLTPSHYVGEGTEADPFMIENNQYGKINTVFTRTNDFMFPSFYGVMIMNTDANIEISNPASFAIQYPVFMNPVLDYYNLPYQNSLGFMFYNTSGLTVFGGASITGWLPSTLSDYPAANMAFIDSSDFLVADNSFDSMGMSLLVYNDNGATASGTVWGNYFMADTITESKYSSHLSHGTDPIGLMMLSSGNLVYNNYFDMVTSAMSPDINPFTSLTASYTNDWDIGGRFPTTDSRTVNNHDLTGAIVQVSYQGGNFWYYFDGTIPFNNGGKISVGGDNYPLILPKYSVIFSNNGLPAGMTWSVKMDKEAITSSGSSITFQVPNGTHFFRIDKPSTYSANPASGTIMVYGESIIKNIAFTLIEYQVTFVQTGHPAGESWSVNLAGNVVSSTGDNITFMKENGTYSYAISGNEYYQANPASGNILVNGADAAEQISFAYSHRAITFSTSGLPDGATWGVTLNGETLNSTSDSIVFMKENGTYSYTVSTPEGYEVSPSAGAVIVYGNDVSTSLVFSEKEYDVVFNVVGLPSGTQWGLVFNGSEVNSTTSHLTFSETNGNYTYEIQPVQGYSSAVDQGYVIVKDQTAYVEVVYNKNPNHAFTAGVMSIGAAAGIGAGVAIAYMFWRKPT